MTVEEKAAIYDQIDQFLSECYEVDEQGNPLDEDMDLIVIGEGVANIMGYL